MTEQDTQLWFVLRNHLEWLFNYILLFFERKFWKNFFMCIVGSLDFIKLEMLFGLGNLKLIDK